MTLRKNSASNHQRRNNNMASKPKKPKLIKYCVTKTIYVTTDVYATNEAEAFDKFEFICLDDLDYKKMVDDADHSIDIQAYD